MINIRLSMSNIDYILNILHSCKALKHLKLTYGSQQTVRRGSKPFKTINIKLDII